MTVPVLGGMIGLNLALSITHRNNSCSIFKQGGETGEQRKLCISIA